MSYEEELRASIERRDRFFDGATLRIERAFRYVEMVAVTALLGAAVSDSLLQEFIILIGGGLSGIYGALPIVRAIQDAPIRLKWTMPAYSQVALILVTAAVMTISWVAATALADLVEGSLASR